MRGPRHHTPFAYLDLVDHGARPALTSSPSTATAKEHVKDVLGTGACGTAATLLDGLLATLVVDAPLLLRAQDGVRKRNVFELGQRRWRGWMSG